MEIVWSPSVQFLLKGWMWVLREVWNCQKSTRWFLHRQRGSNLKLGEGMGGRYVLAFFLIFSVRIFLEKERLKRRG